MRWLCRHHLWLKGGGTYLAKLTSEKHAHLRESLLVDVELDSGHTDHNLYHALFKDIVPVMRKASVRDATARRGSGRKKGRFGGPILT